MENGSWWRDSSAFRGARDYAVFTGLHFMADDGCCTNISMTLQPSIFPKDLFEYAVKIQPGFNAVIDAASKDHDFLLQCFDRIIPSDAFVKGLFDIYMETKKQGNLQTTTLGIQRSDYMIDIKDSKLGLKQVELNTIAAGNPGLNNSIKGFHQYIQSRYLPIGSSPLVPFTNVVLPSVVDAIALSWKEYHNPEAQVLFVVTKGDRNFYDQRVVEFELFNRHQIKSMRKTLSEIAEEGQLDSDRKLKVGTIDIAVVYYRAGYTPDHYPTSKEWHARKILELSRASNCPSVTYQLIGCKKVQQMLSLPNMLERFCSDPVMLADMKGTFAKQYALDQTPEGDAAVEMGLKNPHRYVMKPQREGGGNNLFGDELYAKLSELKSSPEREAYILMDRINPPGLPSAMMKSDSEQAVDTILESETGIFGVFVRKSETDEVLLNAFGGYINREKPLGQDEGGVSHGDGACGSICLVSQDRYMRSIVLSKQ